MASSTAFNLSKLQENHQNMRNICILAHVDHGKTTLADSLISSNGIISSRLAGKLRYMDTREDEQQRGITMKSSAISLIFKQGIETYLINLVDSPGHVDFASEVSTAMCLCDGALILVDVVEGVCSQTLAALRQAWDEGVKPCLVLNKIDRLITTLKLTPLDAYLHLQKIIEKVNAMVANLIASDALQQDDVSNATADEDTNEKSIEKKQLSDGQEKDEEDNDDAKLYFSPEQENVAFASAIHGWAFRLSDFVGMFAKRLSVDPTTLQGALWGDNYLNTKTKTIIAGASKKGKTPLFVQIALNTIWEIYNAVMEIKDAEKVAKIIKSLNLKLSSRETQLNNPGSCLSAIYRQWLPLSRAILSMVCQHVPSPRQLEQARIVKWMRRPQRPQQIASSDLTEYEKACVTCSSDDAAPVIAYVSKLFAAEQSSFSTYRRRDQSNETANCTSGSKELFLGFARVFSGALKKGQVLYALQPNSRGFDSFSSLAPDESGNEGNSEESTHPCEVKINNLYIMMGRDLAEINTAPAGSIVAIGGLENHVWKSATLSSSRACAPLVFSPTDGLPVVRVAVEPRLPSELPRLVAGLRLLSQADPCASVYVQETGEYVIAAAGEVHLKKCLDDLQTMFADVEIDVSDPIVPFRETIVARPSIDMVNEDITSAPDEASVLARLPAYMQKDALESQTIVTKTDDSDLETASADSRNEQMGILRIATPNKAAWFKIRAMPMPTRLLEMLDRNGDQLQKWRHRRGVTTKGEDGTMATDSDVMLSLKKQLNEELAKLSDMATPLTSENIWAVGPKGKATNLLLNAIPSYDRSATADGVGCDRMIRNYDNSVVSGFQLAVATGPMCEEPVRGVCFVVTEWSSADRQTDGGGGDSVGGSLSGQIISTVKEGCRRAFMLQPMRLVVAMYSCQIQATSDVLGRMYAVVGKRNGRIVKEDIIEGTDIFSVTAVLPVADSFGFAEEIRKKTSGLASPQLVFSHWEILDIDPFWIPTTEEEYLHYGDKADSENSALKYLNKTRSRKGLYVEEKTVEHAEKQRTLKKNK